MYYLQIDINLIKRHLSLFLTMLLKLFVWHKIVKIAELTFFLNVRVEVDIIMASIKTTLPLFLVYILRFCFMELTCIVEL